MREIVITDKSVRELHRERTVVVDGLKLYLNDSSLPFFYNEENKMEFCRLKYVKEVTIQELKETMQQKIKKRLIDLNMTQTELGKQLGLTNQYLSAVISGKRINKRVTKWLESWVSEDV